jgi:uncharacterized protein (TIGR00369 family)
MRKLAVSWEDPTQLREMHGRLSGLEFLRAIVRGDLPQPPICSVMGFALVAAERGRTVFAGVPGEHHYNPQGVVHGSFAMALLDSAIGCCVGTLADAAMMWPTIEVKFNLVRPMTAETGRVLAEARIIHGGRRISTAEARLVGDGDSRLYAHATGTCMILKDER